MAAYDLERIAVFIIEDNSYVRRILEDTMRHFRVGKIVSMSDGAEAIEYFKTCGEGQMATSRGPDIVISDLLMAPVNGLLLLRWLRAAKESPNRLLPFIMLSGAADHDYVKASRDLGATEFLAKPFSAESIYKKLLEVIDNPRQFVATHNYFGPDRRRHGYGPPAEERRRVKDGNVTIVYSGDKVVKPDGPTDVWYFRLPNSLKDKVGGLGQSGPGELPLELIEEAEQQLERASLDFTDWAINYLSQLSDLCTEAILHPERRRKHFDEINLLAHELRGQGGTFGYPLISTFGKMLYDVTCEGCPEDDNSLEIVKSHIDAMRAVIRDKVAGDGGEIGRELLKSLQSAIDKHSVVP